MSESKKSTPKTPPIIQEQESEQLSKVDSDKAKLKSWTNITGMLSFLSLFIIALGPPELGLFLTGAFWITSFVLSIRCMAKGVVRTGVSTMIFLTCVMPLLLFVALVSLGNGLCLTQIILAVKFIPKPPTSFANTEARRAKN